MEMMTDSEILDWMEKNLTDLSITRDLKRGNNVFGEFNTPNGCTASVMEQSLRKTIEMANKIMKPWEEK